MGSERAIEEGSGAPKSLFAKASVGTEDVEKFRVAARKASFCFVARSHGLTLLGLWWAWRHFLVRINGGLRCQTVKLFPAYQVDLLEVLHLLL